MNRSSKNILFLAVLTLCFFVNSTTSQNFGSPPTILKSPEDKLAKDNEPFTLECEAKGVPTPKYLWTKNGKNFDWQNYFTKITQESGFGTLHFTQPTKEDDGQYQCFANNSWGTATSNLATVVKARIKPFLENPVENIVVQEGQPFQLYCHAPTGWPKPSVSWVRKYQDQDTFFTIVDNRMTVDSNGTLWISYLEQNDTSKELMYTCKEVFEYERLQNIVFGSLINLTVIESSEKSLKTPLIKQYVTSKNKTAVMGETAELFCIYGGKPQPRTEWFKNGSSIQNNEKVKINNNGNSLSILNVSIEDKGTYTCNVENGVDKPESYTIELDIIFMPYFTIRPEIMEKKAGETAEIRCEASGHPIPEIKWIHNGQPLSLSETPMNSTRKVSSNSIIITNLTKNDIGNYGCNATNSVGYVYQDVYINVSTSAPKIIQPLQNIETVERKSITIGCKNNGVPKPRIKWTNKDNELSDERYFITDTGDLQIRNVELTDSGYYTCFAENDEGADNATTKLTIKERTRIIFTPNDSDVLDDSTVTFYCNVTTDPSLHLNIEWLFNNEPMNFENRYRITKTDNYLTILMTNSMDSGNYTCVAKTELDNVTASMTLSVKERTQIIAYPDNLDSVVGSNVTFYCNVTSDPSLHPNIEWLFNNEPMHFNNQSRLIKTDNSLTLSMINETDTGNYTCMVTTELDNSTAFVKLSVKERTKIKVISEDSNVLVGSNVTFYCNVTTDPSLYPNVEWLFNNEPMNFRSQSRITNTDNNLTILTASLLDSGNYTCVAKTELDNVTASVKLSIKELPKDTIHMELALLPPTMLLIVIISILCIVRHKNRRIYAVRKAKSENTQDNFQNGELAQPFIAQNEAIKNNHLIECETIFISMEKLDANLEKEMTDTNSINGAYSTNGI